MMSNLNEHSKLLSGLKSPQPPFQGGAQIPPLTKGNYFPLIGINLRVFNPVQG